MHSVEDTASFMACIKSARAYLEEQLNIGHKWMIVSTEHMLLADHPREKEDKKKPDITPVRPPPAVVKKVTPTSADITKKTIPRMAAQASGSCRVFVLRLFPSETEMKNGAAFSDEAGMFVVGILEESGIKAENIRKSYLCRFHLDFLPEKSPELPGWLQELSSEISEEDPSLIICFGERISQILTGLKKPIDEIMKTPGLSVAGRKTLFFYDPMFVWKKKKLKENLSVELAKHGFKSGLGVKV